MAKAVKSQVKTEVTDPGVATKTTTQSIITTDAQDSTALNSQVTDSITQADTEVVGVVSAIAMGNFFQSGSQALALAALNATNVQQQSNMTAQSSSTMGVTTLYSIDTATGSVGTSDIFKQMNK